MGECTELGSYRPSFLNLASIKNYNVLLAPRIRGQALAMSHIQPALFTPSHKTS
jgi:hypothetical protein